MKALMSAIALTWSSRPLAQAIDGDWHGTLDGGEQLRLVLH